MCKLKHAVDHLESNARSTRVCRGQNLKFFFDLFYAKHSSFSSLVVSPVVPLPSPTDSYTRCRSPALYGSRVIDASPSVCWLVVPALVQSC